MDEEHGPSEPSPSEPSPSEPSLSEAGPTEPHASEPGAGEHRPPEPGPAPGRGRRVRLLQLTAVLAAVAAGIAAIAATSGVGAPPEYSGPHSATDALVASMLRGVPQHGNMLGSPKAPLTLQYFGDLECPFCREFTVYSLPRIIAHWVRTGKLRIIYRSFETATRAPSVFVTQQVAALAAASQNKMWDYLELFYHEQGHEDTEYVTERYLRGLAKQVPGLNLARWRRERANSKLAATVKADEATAGRVHLPGTPGLFFGPTNGSLQLERPPSLSNPGIFEIVLKNLYASLDQSTASSASG